MALLSHLIKINANQFIEIAQEGNIVALSIGMGDGKLITAGQQRKMRTATMPRAMAKLVGDKLIELAKRKVKKMRDKMDIHGWFELSYAEYLAIPRTVLQSMPESWQHRFVALLGELDETIYWRREGCWVKFKNRYGRFMSDTLGDYERGRRVLKPEEINELVEKHNKFYEGKPI